MTTTAERTTLAVGERPSRRTDLEALPINSIIRHVDSGLDFLKAEGETWNCISATRDPRFTATMTYSMYTVVEVPAAAPSGAIPEGCPQIGELVNTLGNYDRLPVGTQMLGSSSGAIYTIREDRRMDKSNSSRPRDRGSVRLSALTVLSYPGYSATSAIPADVSQETTGVRSETLRQFKQRFRTAVMNAAIASGYTDAVRTACRELDCREEPPVLGQVITLHGNADFPKGVVAATEETTGPRMGVYGWNGSQWVLLVGNQTSAPLKVISGIAASEDDGWASVVGGPEDAVEVAQFKRRAWEVGVRVKQQHGMCGVYEQTMAEVGITPTSAEAEALTPEQVLALPVGSVLVVEVSRDQVAWYRRVEGADNPCGTVRIGGTLDGHWAQVMHLMHSTGAAMSLIPASHAQMDALPTGSRILYGSTRYTKRPDRRWTTNGYSSPSTDFYLRDTRIVHIA